MELLNLSLNQFEVTIPGIYVMNDEGIGVIAGPFVNESEALFWIEHTVPVRQH